MTVRASSFLAALAVARAPSIAPAGILDSPPAKSASGLTPVEHVRGADQTYLTFPEWFLVHSPAEYAAHVKQHAPSDFPFWGHIGQQ